MDKLAKKKGERIGFWGWVSIIFVGFAVLMHAVHGARYLVDDEYREKERAESMRKEQKAFARRVQENQLRWIINGCDVPGTCNELGHRLDSY